MDEKKVRGFIAIDISREAQEELARISSELKKTEHGIKWTRPYNIHLTLKFLGDMTEDQVKDVSVSLTETAKKHAPFDIALGETGAFPGWSSPRVLWIGLSEGGEDVRGLAGTVDEEMAGIGFAGEARGFYPHLTIGRVKRGKRTADLKKNAKKISVKPLLSRVSRVILYSSRLLSGGAVYSPLFSARLSGGYPG